MTYPGAHPREKVAIIHADSGRELLFGDLDDRSDALARYLRDAGLTAGDTVAFLSENTIEIFEVFWAAQRSGLYVTGINHHLTAGEIAFILGDSGAKILISSSTKADLARAAREVTPGVEHLLAWGTDIPSDLESYEDALALGADASPLDSQPSGATMLYSSGTTGRPKGIRPPLPTRTVDEPGETVAGMASSLYGFAADTVYYSPAPAYHAAPLRWVGAATALGGTAVIRTRFDAEQTLRDIETYRITAGQFVPTMFIRMLKLPDDVRSRYDTSSIRTAIHAAAACPVEVKNRMLDWWGDVVYEYYSSTEMNGITAISPQVWREHAGSVGQAIVGVIHVCDDDGRELAAGETGVVFFERDHLPFEYHHDPAKTAAAQHPAHPLWTTTGDVGRVDEQGYLFLTDRKAFTIISGGVNIYPQEIENALALHPAVLDAAVIGLPDDEWGECVTAVIQPAAGAEPGSALADEITEFLRGTLARFKVPRQVLFTQDMPRTPTGKLVKADLVRRYTVEAARSAV
ncbi:fatty-acyl-CoA synthase [Microbacterium terrae]|uniref:Long-chain-fatty-acid--CoA ligase FadD13 n=1 Tax=Microbacterium terrae TaxID=69369 RepID=A0A0M2GUZ5_9MICO|nr:acyl-CoA synthetase [Microbacterium terrae]KJL37511.1 Long-chain-fatty-acid--CoA ligase FadD13 [Microbacterium terrae]MBP1076340.1 fatty-acyl-CoA synthase [Microbacterium terrae]GLJ97164.1 putative acyl-CoA ligase [Microbacterium terrae]